MRVAIVYDCMFPYTVGGAERWYVNLAERLQRDGHEVTYLTMRQWERGETIDSEFETIAVGPRMHLYTESGRRRIVQALVFGAAMFWHLLRHGGRYDLVHGASFPYFWMFGAKLVLIPRRAKLVIDWHEVWSMEYWRGYLGAIGGRIGHAVQSLCTRLPDHNFAFSQMHAARLPGDVTVLRGEFVEGERPAAPAAAAEPPTVVFAGRMIPEKNVLALPAALAAARERVEFKAVIFGDGPDREELLSRIEGLDFVDAPGFVDHDLVQSTLGSAACLVLPSSREGYGLIVVEANSLGTPAVLVQGVDNAATELIEPGVNGIVAAAPDAESLGAAIADAVEQHAQLRSATWDWYEANRAQLSIDDSVQKIEAEYGKLAGPAQA